MPADIVNLRGARKQKARLVKEAAAAENRVRFGRTKAERQQASAEEQITRRRLDGHVRKGDGDES